MRGVGVIFFLSCILSFVGAVDNISLVRLGPFNFTEGLGRTNNSYAFYIVRVGRLLNDGASGVPTGLNWTAAKQNASSQGGYLATITSQYEQNFLMQQLVDRGYVYPNTSQSCLSEPNKTCVGVYGNATCTYKDADSLTTGFDLWIGLSDARQEGIWEWVTGPETNLTVCNVSVDGDIATSRICNQFHYFRSDEPNNWKHIGPEFQEDCGMIQEGSQNDFNCIGPLWNDKPCGNTYGWIVEWDAPTAAPTTSPTTLAPTLDIPCDPCKVPLCPTLTDILVDKTTCTRMQHLGRIGGSWTSSPLLARAAQNTICCYLDWWLNESVTCYENFDQNLYDDLCDSIRSNLVPKLQEDLKSYNWCLVPTHSNFSNITQCPPLTSVIYASHNPTNTSLPEILHNLPCTELSQKRFIAQQPPYFELGPLAAVKANASQYPDIPPIEKAVSDDRTTAILYNTACLQTSVVNVGWLAWLICFYIFAGCCLLFVWKRRNLLPVRARTPILMYGSVFWIVLNFTWVAIDQITGMTAPCGLISFGNLVAFPMLLIIYLVRALRLLFLYLSSVRKLSHKRDWFFEHRSWLSARSAAIVLGVFLACFLIIFIVANAVDGTFSETYLGSGRCQWWDINEAITSAAGAYGVDLGPTEYNQNGFVPYSPEYSSCVFCTSSGTNTFMAVFTGILLLLLLISLLAMIRLRDQFLLRLELFCVLCTFIVMAVLRILMFFPGSAQNIMDGMGLDISLLLLALSLIAALLATTVMPAMMTFSRRYRTSNDTGVTSAIRKGEPTLEEVLRDPLGLSLFKQFETESFQVENISFHQDMQELKSFELTDEERSKQVEKIYSTYIQANSLMEVNIDFHMRSKYQNFEERNQPDAYEDVLKVVMVLLNTNSWMRFRKSSLWTAYLADIKERQRDEVGMLSQMESTHSIAHAED